jgi:hypothetical protein
MNTTGIQNAPVTPHSSSDSAIPPSSAADQAAGTEQQHTAG